MTSLEPVHFTNLKQIALSPAHYLSAVQVGHHKKCFGAGRLLHFLVLGGNYVVYEGKRQGKAWKEFADAHQGADIFTRAEVDREIAVANAVKNHPIAGPLLVGEHEREVEWEWMGRSCSSRLDVLGPRRVVDLKRAATAEPERFARAAVRYGYHAQGAFYEAAAKHIGHEVDEVILIAVEPAPPYAVTVFRLTRSALLVGQKICRLWMERLLACEAANEWPEYVQSIVDLDVNEGPDLIFGDELDALADDAEEAAQ